MDFSLRFFRLLLLPFLLLLLLLLLSTPSVLAGDIVHEDDLAPKKRGCENNFVLVKVQTWVNGKEANEFVGVGARFGTTMESKEKYANHSKVAIPDPPDCCSTPKTKFAGEVLLVHRGSCKFTTKAKIAQSVNASAILIINYHKELYKMVCDPSETEIDIHIPAVMLPQDAGSILEKHLNKNSSVSVQLYSPERPLVDIAEVFLWLMAVGTILCASYWSAWSAREAAIEQEKLLKDGSDDYLNVEDTGATGVVDINTISAILFVVIASGFLVMLYKFMSFWFVELLVVLFCIGGVEGLQTCLVALLSRWFKRAGDMATFLFLYVTILTVMGVSRSPNKCATVGIQGIAWAFGGMIFALVYCTAGISGGHINPAVTFGLLLARKLSLTRAVFYMVMQCLGAICGAGVVKGFQKGPYELLGGGANVVNHGYTKGDGLGAEIIGTFVLVYTVFSATDAKRNARDSHVPILAPLPIGFAVFLVHLATIPITGTGINPARSLGAAIIYNKDHAWDDHWIFWVGPFIGAALAAVYHQIIIRAIPFKARA